MKKTILVILMLICIIYIGYSETTLWSISFGSAGNFYAHALNYTNILEISDTLYYYNGNLKFKFYGYDRSDTTGEIRTYYRVNNTIMAYMDRPDNYLNPKKEYTTKEYYNKVLTLDISCETWSGWFWATHKTYSPHDIILKPDEIAPIITIHTSNPPLKIVGEDGVSRNFFNKQTDCWAYSIDNETGVLSSSLTHQINNEVSGFYIEGNHDPLTKEGRNFVSYKASDRLYNEAAKSRYFFIDTQFPSIPGETDISYTFLTGPDTENNKWDNLSLYKITGINLEWNKSTDPEPQGAADNPAITEASGVKEYSVSWLNNSEAISFYEKFSIDHENAQGSINCDIHFATDETDSSMALNDYDYFARGEEYNFGIKSFDNVGNPLSSTSIDASTYNWGIKKIKIPPKTITINNITYGTPVLDNGIPSYPVTITLSNDWDFLSDFRFFRIYYYDPSLINPETHFLGEIKETDNTGSGLIELESVLKGSEHAHKEYVYVLTTNPKYLDVPEREEFSCEFSGGIVANLAADFSVIVSEESPENREWRINKEGYFENTTTQAAIITKDQLSFSLSRWIDPEGDILSFKIYSLNNSALTEEFFEDTITRTLFRTTNVRIPCYVSINEYYGNDIKIENTRQTLHEAEGGEEGILLHFDHIDPYGNFELAARGDDRRILSLNSPANTTEVSLAITDTDMQKLLSPDNNTQSITFRNIDASQFSRPDKLTQADIISTENSALEGMTFQVDGNSLGNDWVLEGNVWYHDWELIPADGPVDENRLVAMKIDDGANIFYAWYMTRLLTISPAAPPDLGGFRHIHTEENGLSCINVYWEPVDPVSAYAVTFPGFSGDTEPDTIVVDPAGDNSEVLLTIITENNFTANESIPLTIRTQDTAGNVSMPVTYTVYTLPSVETISGPFQDYTAENGLSITWTLENSKAAEARILYKQAGDTVFNEVKPLSQPATTLELFHLVPHGSYDYKIRVYNGFVHPITGEQSDFIEIEDNYTLVNNVPAAPGLVSPMDYGNPYLSFVWNRADDPDLDVMTYRLFVENPVTNAIVLEREIIPQAEGSLRYIPTEAERNLLFSEHGTHYSWYVITDDGFGGICTTEKRDFQVDAEIPVITFQDLPSTAFTNRESISIHVSETISGIMRIEYYTSCATYTASHPGIVDISTKKIILHQPVENQAYDITVKVINYAGTEATATSPVMQVDKTNPENISIDLGFIEGDIYDYAQSLAFIGTAVSEDDYSGVRFIEYAFVNSLSEDVALWTQLNETELSEGIPGEQQAAGNMIINGTDKDELFLLWRTIDYAGNVSNISTMNKPILIDTTPPEGNIYIQGSTYYQSKNYTSDMTSIEPAINVYDPHSGIKEMIYALPEMGMSIDDVIFHETWEEAISENPQDGMSFRIIIKAKNKADLTAFFPSEEIIYDSTPPDELALIYNRDQAIAPGEVMQITAHAVDNHSPITLYSLGIGSAPGDTTLSSNINGNVDGWLLLSATQEDPLFTFLVPENVVSGTYAVTLNVCNTTGLSATLIDSNNTFNVERIQEKVVVLDQGPFQRNIDTAAGSWEYKGTQTITGYEYRVPGAGDAYSGWIQTHDTSVLLPLVDIVNGTHYWFEVRALYEAGGYAEGKSIGVTIDTTGPEFAVESGLTVPYASTPDNMMISWDVKDPESGIQRVEVMPEWIDDGSLFGLAEEWIVLPLTETGYNISVSRDNIGNYIVYDSDVVFLNLRVTNRAGLTTEKRSGPIIIDTTPPPAPIVIDQGNTINLNQKPSATWFWSDDDPESGIESYEWTIVRESNDIETALWQTDDGSRSINLEELGDFDFNPLHGETWYFAVKAINRAGLESTGFSNGITFDAEGPFISTVKLFKGREAIDPDSLEELNYINSPEDVSVYIKAHDLLSTITDFSVSQGKFTPDLNWQDLDENHFWTDGDSLVSLDNPGPLFGEGEVVYFQGNCIDGAGNISSSGYTKGVVLDTAKPIVSDVFGFVTGDTLIFNWEATQGKIPITGYNIELKETGLQEAVYTGVVTDKNIIIDCNEENIPDGSYELFVQGVNASGSVSDWAGSRSIVLDRVRPEIDSLTCNLYVNDSLWFTATAHDNVSYVGEYQYALGTIQDFSVFTQGWMSVVTTEESITDTILFEDLPGGTESFQHDSEIILSIRVKDGADQWSDITVSPPVIVDKTAPHLIVTDHNEYTRFNNRIGGIDISTDDIESGVVMIRAAIVPELSQQALLDADWNSIEITSNPGEQYNGENYEFYLNPGDFSETMLQGSVYYVVIKSLNRSGLWSPLAQTPGIIVDTSFPALVFNTGDEEVVYNETDDFHIPYTIVEDVSPYVDVEFVLRTDTGFTYFSSAEIEPGSIEFFDFSYERPGYGTYELFAHITDKAGNIVPGTDSLFIRVNRPHSIDFLTGTTDYYETNPAKPLNLDVHVIDFDGDDQGPFLYSWDFNNDGTEDSNVQNPLTTFEHTFITNQETNYSITLTVIDRNSLSVTDTVMVKVVNTSEGTLFTDEYWSGIHTLKGRIVIPPGITITTAPETDVRIGFNTTCGYDYDLLVQGTLDAGPGTSFGIADNVPGKWKGIYTEGEALLLNTKIEDAIRGITVVTGSSALIENCVFNNNEAGIHVYETEQTIHGTEFSNNRYGIKEEKGSIVQVTDCNFRNNTFDYYHKTLTRLTLAELNSLPGCEGNTNGEGE